MRVHLLSFRFPWHWSSPNATSGRRERMEGKDQKKMWMIFRSWYKASSRQHHHGLWLAALPIRVVMRYYCIWLSYGITGSSTNKYLPFLPQLGVWSLNLAILCNIINIAVAKAVNPCVNFFFPPVPGGNRNSQTFKFRQHIEMALNYCTWNHVKFHSGVCSWQRK